MEVPVPIAELVSQAQAGDREAWTALVTEFHDVAIGLATGFSGNRTLADDIAQDAFVTAFEHLGDLVDPQAFPAWFVTIVRTAAHRQSRGETRRASLRTTVEGTVAATGADPVDVVVSGDESRRIRSAVENLPEHERSVVALHYLAGLPYARVAELLGITVAAAKKRAFAARRRLKDALPRTVPAAARPAAAPTRDPLALFRAIRARDEAQVRDLLARDPTLVDATEAWSKAEAMALGLQNAEAATPLVRAVQTGAVDLVRLVLAAGADPAARCGCAGAETALWTAALYGDVKVVETLLGAGADPNAAAFAAVTPLAVAAQRGHDEIIRKLLVAGAEPSLSDAGGRTAADWARLRRSRPRPTPGDLLATGVRALDLFAPIARGSVQWWPAAWELGQFALLTEIVRAIGPGAFWQIGFATGSYNAESGRQWAAQFPLETQLGLTPEAGPRPNAARTSRLCCTS